MEEDMVNRNPNGLGIDMADIMTKVKRKIEDSDLVTRDILSELRSRASEFKKALNNKKEKIVDYTMIDGPQILESDMTSGLIESSAVLSTVIPKIDVCAVKNEVLVQALVVSNLENNKLMVPTSFNKEHPLNISFWTDSLDWIDEYARDVKMKVENNEPQKLNEGSSLNGYVDYPDSTSMAKGLKYGKYEFDRLTQSEKNAISRKLKFSREPMSRFSRLVIAYLYLIALDTRDGDVDIRIARRDGDSILDCDPANLSALSSRDDLAYVHCNRPADKHYIGFLYIISREFPFALNLLRKEVDDVGCYAKCSNLIIREEAPYIGIFCDETPSWRGLDEDFTFNRDMWYAYLVNYARSIGVEAELDAAHACASVMYSHELLPNVSLPQRRSAGELFQRAHSTKTVEGIVPTRTKIKEFLLGGFCAAAGAMHVYKDIKSHDLITSEGAGVQRTMISHIIRGDMVRDKWYRFLGGQGMRCSIATLRKIDFLDFDMGSDQCGRLNNLQPLPFYCLSTLDQDKVIDHGFSTLYGRCPYQTRNKLGTQRPQTRAKTLALMRELDLVKGPVVKASLLLRNPDYDTGNCRITERWLHPGEVSIVKGGVSVPIQPFRTDYIEPNRETVAPAEFMGDEDHLVWDDVVDGEEEKRKEEDDESDRDQEEDENIIYDDDIYDHNVSDPSNESSLKIGGIVKMSSDKNKAEVEKRQLYKLYSLMDSDYLETKNLKSFKAFKAAGLLVFDAFKRHGPRSVEYEMASRIYESKWATMLNDWEAIQNIAKGKQCNYKTKYDAFLAGNISEDYFAKEVVVYVTKKDFDNALATSIDALIDWWMMPTKKDVIEGCIYWDAREKERSETIESEKDTIADARELNEVVAPKIIREMRKTITLPEGVSLAIPFDISTSSRSLDQPKSGSVGSWDNNEKEIDEVDEFLQRLRKMGGGVEGKFLEKKKSASEMAERAALAASSLPQATLSSKEKKEKKKSITKKMKKLVKQIRSEKTGQTGSAPRFDSDWFNHGVNALLESDHSEHGDTKKRKTTLLKFFNTVPDEFCACCMDIITEDALACEDMSNAWLVSTARFIGISAGDTKKMLKSQVIKRLLYKGGPMPGVGRNPVKISDKKVTTIKSLLLKLGADPIIKVRDPRGGGSMRVSLSTADTAQTRSWLTYGDYEDMSNLRDGDRAKLVAEWLEILRKLS